MSCARKFTLLAILLISQARVINSKEEEYVSIMKEAIMPARSNLHHGRFKRPTTSRQHQSDSSVEEPKLCFPFSEYPHNLMLTTSNFMPDINNAQHCFDQDSEDFQSHLRDLGNPDHCVVGNQLTTDNVGYGLGSVINSWTKVFFFFIFIYIYTYSIIYCLLCCII